MATDSLKDLYRDQVQDLFSACTQSRAATKKLRDLATDRGLQEALDDAVAGIERGADAMASIADGLGAAAEAKHCKGTEGLVAEAKSDLLDEDFTDMAARDAAIIAQYQRMAHYAIAGYGTILAFAKRLGRQQDADLVQTCLDKSYDGDRRFTELATDGINAEAA